jgi:hypothetical protein
MVSVEASDGISNSNGTMRWYASGDGPWAGRFGRIADCAQAA